MMEYVTVNQILEKSKEAEGKRFSDYDINNRLDSRGNKGGLGQVIEEGLFEYQINSDSSADFEELGIELKVTPIKINKIKSLSAKERLVLNIINYMTEHDKTFEESSFWKKNQQLLMMFYLWEKDLDRKDYKILKSILYSVPVADLEIIRQDWETILGKIRAGKAEELSEGDTLYLAACTKGANRSSLRKQPFSDALAMQRAYSLKASYMTVLIRQKLNNEKVISFAKANELRTKTLEELLYEKFDPYLGKTVSEISNEIDYAINMSNKSAIPNMISRILGITGTRLDKIEEFEKANIQFKTIRLEPDGIPKEHMSFENIDFNYWLESEWEDSQLYEKFEPTKFLFIVFQYSQSKDENPEREPVFKKIKLWNMPEKVINEELKKMWIEVKSILSEGVQLIDKGNRVLNNLPKPKSNGVVHIRPKAKDGSDKTALPDGQRITKQCYWLDREYVAKIIK